MIIALKNKDISSCVFSVVVVIIEGTILWVVIVVATETQECMRNFHFKTLKRVASSEK